MSHNTLPSTLPLTTKKPYVTYHPRLKGFAFLGGITRAGAALVGLEADLARRIGVDGPFCAGPDAEIKGGVKVVDACCWVVSTCMTEVSSVVDNHVIIEITSIDSSEGAGSKVGAGDAGANNPWSDGAGVT